MQYADWLPQDRANGQHLTTGTWTPCQAYLDVQVVPGDISRWILDAVQDIPDDALLSGRSRPDDCADRHHNLASLWLTGSWLRGALDGECDSPCGIATVVPSLGTNLQEQIAK